MEIAALYNNMRLVRFIFCALCLLAFIQAKTVAQSVKTCSIKNGRMYIGLSKQINNASLDSFIIQYNLQDLPLKEAIKKKTMEPMKKLGWTLEISNNVLFVISKPLFGVNNINNPANKIIFAEKHPTIAERFPSEQPGLVYGYNRFRNKFPFAVNGSVVTFFLRNNLNATRVMLAGSFNEWAPDALAMTKTDSGWIANVKLTPGKYWYKFISDGDWSIDNDNLLRENDGLGNVNSVYYKTNILFALNGYANAKRTYVSGSFNNWRRNELQMFKTEAGWKLPLYLAKGTHTYKFIADGEWLADPNNPHHLPDGEKGYNSVITIGNPFIFKLTGYINAKQVVLTGSFNNWRKDELFMKKSATGWELPYTLAAGNYEYRFIVDGKEITDPSNPLITDPKIKKANSFLITDPNFTFRLKGFNNAKTIFLAGDFNNWNPFSLPMQHKGDEWIFSVHLSPGKHLYKFIADGVWMKDPGNKLWEQNEYNTGNSVIWITN